MSVRLFSIFLVLISTFAASLRISAQQLSDEDRNRYVTQVRAYKHKFLAKELDLSKDQQEAFFELFDKMEDLIIDLGIESRDAEAKALSDDASVADIDAASAALYTQKLREGEIEVEYFNKLKEVLTPRQLVRLKGADRRFNQQLMRQHRRIRSERKAENR